MFTIHNSHPIIAYKVGVLLQTPDAYVLQLLSHQSGHAVKESFNQSKTPNVRKLSTFASLQQG